MRRWILILALLLSCVGCKSTPISPGVSLDDLLETSFEGAAVESEASLREVVLKELTSGTSAEAAQVTKADVDDAAYALELHYRDAGYADVEVRYEFEATGEERPRARFTIEEGPLVSIREVVVEGAGRLSEEELGELLGEVRSGAPFVRARLSGAVGSLRSFYRVRGFQAVEITGFEIERITADAVRVSLNVNEGPRYVLHSATVEGAAPELQSELDSLVTGAIGQHFVPHLAYQLRAGALRAHGDAGYPDCTVTIELAKDDTTGNVALALKIVCGPQVRVSGIEVRGNEDVPTKRVRSRIDLGNGDIYAASRVNRSFNQLYATGLFDVVSFDLEGEGPERKVIVDVSESPSLQFFTEPGWGSYEGPRLRVGLRENNLLSTGRRGSLEGWLSSRAHGLELQITDPFLFGGEVTGQMSLFATNREEPSFTVDETGVGIDFRRPLSKHLSASIGYEYESTRLSDVSGSVPSTLDEDLDIGEVIFALSYDTRNNVVMPTTGGLVRFSSSVAADSLGSQLQAYENSLDLRRVLPIGEHTFIAASGRFAVIAPYGDTDVIPLQRRQFNGGENTVRSFRESELGPVDSDDDPLGGEARTVLSVELRRRLRGNVSGAVFYDLGNVELDHQDFLQFDDMRSGIGVGIRYLLPIGPLRLDAAVNPDPRSGESDWVIHFAVGLPY